MCIFGHKYGKVEEGFQYCVKCGYARKLSHEHHWELQKEIIVYDVDLYGTKSKLPTNVIRLNKCSICGEEKKYM
jgi:hypothetical protein